MAIIYEGKELSFESIIYEDEVVELRNFLQTNAGEEITFDFVKCEDLHLAILQLVVSYQKNYPYIYKFADDKKLFETVLKGFDPSENYCN
ncbi:MAG: hypothetical protein U9P38_07125 [Campylobacterota bacterium]|nr:hypothetical protein [Campylobacterota bacterium]